MTRRPVKDRWFYEPKGTIKTALASTFLQRNLGDEDKNGDVGDMDQNHFGTEIFGKTNENLANLVVPDQSKGFLGKEKLLDTSLEIRDSTHNDVSKILRVDKLKEKDVTGICSAFAQFPATLGPVETVPKYLEEAEDNEEAAWDLQGLVFHDDDMGW
jgi:hypothetical protein